jgi:CheY-like chemotaxis protein
MQTDQTSVDLDECLPQKLILLVDDDLNFLDLVGDYLDFKGLKIMTAESEQQGWELYCQVKPALIVSGIAMTDIDCGYKLLQRVRENDCHQPFIFLSTQMNIPSKRKRAVELGADACFGKPFEPESLFSAIQRLLQSAKGVEGLI